MTDNEDLDVDDEWKKTIRKSRRQAQAKKKRAKAKNLARGSIGDALGLSPQSTKKTKATNLSDARALDSALAAATAIDNVNVRPRTELSSTNELYEFTAALFNADEETAGARCKTPPPGFASPSEPESGEDGDGATSAGEELSEGKEAGDGVDAMVDARTGEITTPGKRPEPESADRDFLRSDASELSYQPTSAEESFGDFTDCESPSAEILAEAEALAKAKAEAKAAAKAEAKAEAKAKAKATAKAKKKAKAKKQRAKAKAFAQEKADYQRRLEEALQRSAEATADGEEKPKPKDKSQKLKHSKRKAKEARREARREAKKKKKKKKKEKADRKRRARKAKRKKKKKRRYDSSSSSSEDDSSSSSESDENPEQPSGSSSDDSSSSM